MTADAAAVAPPASGVDLTLVVDVPAWTADIADVEAIAARAVTAVADGVGLGEYAGRALEVGLRLTCDAAVRDLNRDYRAQDKPTNVLSFPATSPDELAWLPVEAPLMLGDIVIAHGTVMAEASAAAKLPADHLSHLIIHGMLHLLGYDHDADADAANMESLEIKLLAGLGITDPYGADTADATVSAP